MQKYEEPTVSAPEVRRVRTDLYFVEWGNVRFGGTFFELTKFAIELQNAMTKAIGGDPEFNPARAPERTR